MPTITKYEYTPEMGEISGMGGGYEQCCRDMVLAGVKWMEEHPDAKPEFGGFKNIYGVILEENQDAKDLTKAVIDASKGNATGAMHQATIGHVLAIKRLGWEGYFKEMRERSQD